MIRNRDDDRLNQYIREKIRQVRTDAQETQDKLAGALEKSRVAISDIERGRVTVSAADLALIANHYQKPISFFFPPLNSISADKLSPLEQEALMLLQELPSTQQHIALAYIKQQADISKKAYETEMLDIYRKAKAVNKHKK